MAIGQRSYAWVRGWRVRTKLAALVSLLLGGIAAFIFVYFPTTFANQAKAAMRARATSIGQMAAFSVAPGMFFGDSVAIHDALQAPRQNPDVLYLAVLDTVGHKVAIVNRDQAPLGFDRRNAYNTFMGNGSVYNTAVPILSNTKPIGMLFVGISMRELHAQEQQSRATI